MTPDQTKPPAAMDERARFDKWMAETPAGSNGEDMALWLSSACVEAAWVGWQAARASQAPEAGPKFLRFSGDGGKTFDKLASVSLSVPEGMQMVPVEPTEAMLDAAVAFALCVSLSKEYTWSDYMRDLYGRFMFAAPQKEQS